MEEVETQQEEFDQFDIYQPQYNNFFVDNDGFDQRFNELVYPRSSSAYNNEPAYARRRALMVAQMKRQQQRRSQHEIPGPVGRCWFKNALRVLWC